MKIYTIGHSNYSIERLLNMLKKYNIDTVVDIRGTPYSKYNVQYNKEVFENSLKNLGYQYLYMAPEFAAKRINKMSYNEEGYADFEKVIHEESFSNGIIRLKNGLNKGYKIVLLGAMQDPIRCHRSILVGRELTKNDFDVRHIIDDYSTIDQKQIESNLLNKYFPDRNQITIDSLLGCEKDENTLINEGYKLANREIGYRVENLTKL